MIFPKLKLNGSLRPPGISYLLLPFLYCSIPLGLCLKITIFFLKIVSYIGWIKISHQLKLNKNWILFLSIFLGLNLFNTNFNLSSASVLTNATLPWLLLWAINICRNDSYKSFKNSTMVLILFYFILGFHAFLNYLA